MIITEATLRTNIYLRPLYSHSIQHKIKILELLDLSIYHEKPNLEDSLNLNKIIEVAYGSGSSVDFKVKILAR